MIGWIKLHRSIISWEWYSDNNTKTVFIHLLLTANIENKVWRGIKIDRGQLFTSVHNLAKELHLSDKKIRIALNKLKRTNEVVISGANNGTMITVCNYETYQSFEKQDGKQEGKQNGKQRATTKEYKKKKIEIFDDVKSSYKECVDIYNKFIIYKTGVKPIFNEKQGLAMKQIINYLYKNTKDVPPTNQSIYNGLNFILNNFDKWSQFHKSNTELTFIYSKIVDIIKDIQVYNKKEKENKN